MWRDHETQTLWVDNGVDMTAVCMPAPAEEVMPGILWGCASELFTPAFWKYLSQVTDRSDPRTDYRLGKTLLEEVAVCLLGGFGMPAELGLAAFHRLSKKEMLDGSASQREIEDELTTPFTINGRQRRYRFPYQKSRYLANALAELADYELPEDAIELRNLLTAIAGIGPKTASWIVRNHLASDAVAILDVHIMRAGKVIGIFSSECDPAREYFGLETKFLDFCLALDEPASLVDSLIWDVMRRIGRTPVNTRQESSPLTQQASRQ